MHSEISELSDSYVSSAVAQIRTPHILYLEAIHDSFPRSTSKQNREFRYPASEHTSKNDRGSRFTIPPFDKHWVVQMHVQVVIGFAAEMNL